MKTRSRKSSGAVQTSRRPRLARFFRWVAPAMDRGGLGVLRHPLLAGLTGDVIEIGLGEGPNLPHYSPQVDRLVAVEPSLSCDEHPGLPRTTHPSPWR